MANYYGTARSNYFKVKDPQVFEAWANDIGLKHWTNVDGLHAISPSNASDDGVWPSARWSLVNADTGEEDWVEYDILDELWKFLEEGQVAVLLECGAEKLRYVIGVAQAIDWRGKVIYLSIDDIYGKAEKKFKVEVTRAEY